MNRNVYIAFATGPEPGDPAFVDRVAQDHPDTTLLVVARQRPRQGEWLEVRDDRGVRGVLSDVRTAIAGRPIAGAAIHATKQGGGWPMRFAAVALTGARLRIYNDNLDHFPLMSLPTLSRHLKWRWMERSRGSLRWRMLAHLALIAPRFAIDREIKNDARQYSFAEPAGGISVVIPTRDGRELLTSMLPDVIADLASLSHEVIVVDNGSSDGTAAYLAASYPALRVVSTRDPLSFAAAVNRGIGIARYSHVALLNNDMSISPRFFATLQSKFQMNPDLFCATAQIFFPAGHRREETGLCFWSSAPGDGFPIYCATPSEGEDETPVLYGSGGCSMYDARKLRALGGFDECYRPAYVEDLDIGYRAWLRGWPTVFSREAQVEHRHRTTTSRYYSPDYLDYLVERNYLRFLVRSTGGIFPDLWRGAILRLSRRAAAGDHAARRALLTAWFEALSRKTPPSAVDEFELKKNLTRGDF